MKSTLYRLNIFIFLFFISVTAFSSPRINFTDLMINSLEDPSQMQLARQQAVANNMPLSVLLPGNIKMDVMGLEDGKIVYSVITNFAHPTIGARTMFYDELIAGYNISEGRIYYGNGVLVDNTNGLFDPQVSERGSGPFLLIPDSSTDRIVMFDAQTGDVVDPFFFPASTPNFGTPKIALQTQSATMLVSDQVTDGVFEYDTTGSSLGIFAPMGGVNTSILDNIRGMLYRPNGNLLVAVGGGGNINTIQEFDTAGVNLGAFINSNLTSPFNLAYRSGDMLVSMSGGTKLNKYTFTGTYIGVGITGTYNFFQQIYVHPGDSFAVANLTGTAAGIVTFDSAGNQTSILNGVTSNYGVYKLGNGNYITSNLSGVYEINPLTGASIRTIITMGGQYISLYDPSSLVSIGSQTGVIPNDYKLYSNYPNPFNPSTKIKFAIPNNGITKVAVYNSLGKEVAVLVNRFHSAGEYEYNFDAAGLSSGVYFYTLTSGDFRETKKMVLLK